MKILSVIVFALVTTHTYATTDLGAFSTEELVSLLSHKNSWQRRQAQHLLSERITAQDTKAIEALVALARSQAEGEMRIGALGVLSATKILTENLLNDCASDVSPEIRSWTAHCVGERRDSSKGALTRLEKLASDSNPAVRLAVATAVRQLVSSSLTVDTDINTDVPVGKILCALIKSSADAKDPLLPFMIWMAGEPTFAKNPKGGLQWLAENGADTMPLSGILARKSMRRICDTGEPEKLNQAVEFLEKLFEQKETKETKKDSSLTSLSSVKKTDLIVASLDGLIEGQRAKPLVPTVETKTLLAKLTASSKPQIQERAQKLGTLWGDAAATEKTLAAINDPKASLDERIKAIQSAQQLKNAAARDAVLNVILSGTGVSPVSAPSESHGQDARATIPEPLVLEALHSLSTIGSEETADKIVANWSKLSPTARRAAVDMLASRGVWVRRLLDGLENKTISPSEISATVARTLLASKNPNFASRAQRVLGRYREADADKLKIIAAKKKIILSAEPNIEHGHEIAKKTCFVCHKLYGEGADVGPDLTGVGRSTLDALLANVIDPNQIVGKGYENVEVETKDGRSVSGRLVEENDTQMKLISAGPKEDVIAKSDIESKRVSELSVMPEGLEQMPEADFRDLIWFILNPPQDNRPLTPEVRAQLIGK